MDTKKVALTVMEATQTFPVIVVRLDGSIQYESTDRAKAWEFALDYRRRYGDRVTMAREGFSRHSVDRRAW